MRALIVWWWKLRQKRIAAACAKYGMVAYDARSVRLLLTATMATSQAMRSGAIPTKHREFVTKAMNDCMMVLAQPMTPFDQIKDETGQPHPLANVKVTEVPAS